MQCYARLGTEAERGIGCAATQRLKQKSQSVDIAGPRFSPTLTPASPLNRAASPSPVARTTAGLAVKEHNVANTQHRSPRCSELKRGYTIGCGTDRIAKVR
ncbi:unnamed protein product [Boreogadus saida]